LERQISLFSFPAEAIRLAGGAVTCDAKLTRLKSRDTYQLLLDVKLPIEVERH